MERWILHFKPVVYVPEKDTTVAAGLKPATGICLLFMQGLGRFGQIVSVYSPVVRDHPLGGTAP
jgi:hypothetical protein